MNVIADFLWINDDIPARRSLIIKTFQVEGLPEFSTAFEDDENIGNVTGKTVVFLRGFPGGGRAGEFV